MRPCHSNCYSLGHRNALSPAPTRARRALKARRRLPMGPASPHTVAKPVGAFAAFGTQPICPGIRRLPQFRALRASKVHRGTRRFDFRPQCAKWRRMNRPSPAAGSTDPRCSSPEPLCSPQRRLSARGGLHTQCVQTITAILPWAITRSTGCAFYLACGASDMFLRVGLQAETRSLVRGTSSHQLIP